MGQEVEPYKMNFPKGMKAQLMKEAKAQRRSLASYLIVLLETHPDRSKKPAVRRP